jgi:hypothetical protein
VKGIIAVIVLLLIVSLFPQPAAAQVDTWRVLHVGLESGARVDMDGDGRVNSWYECTTRPNGSERCKSLKRSTLYRQWQRDVRCFPATIERWTGYQIAIEQDSVFIETTEPLRASPYEFAWGGWADQYNFAAYDVIIVWVANTQPLVSPGNGNAWGPVAGNYGFVANLGIGGYCDSYDGGIVPAHEFAHTVSWLYDLAGGFNVCPIYDYPYTKDGGEGEHRDHTLILTNQWPTITCSNGKVSNGVPPEAWASGSYRDYYA